MTAPADVASALRQRILSLEYAPDLALREIQIAAEFDASRRTVREALLVLDREGIVVHERNRGARVRRFTANEVRDLYRMRAALETFGASWAGSATPSRIAAVAAAYDRLVGYANEAQDSLTHAVADMTFHGAVTGLADSSKLDRAFAELSVEMTLAIRVLQHDEVSEALSADEVIAEHAAIQDAVRDGDALRTVRTVRAHISTNERRLIRLAGLEGA